MGGCSQEPPASSLLADVSRPGLAAEAAEPLGLVPASPAARAVGEVGLVIAAGVGIVAGPAAAVLASCFDPVVLATTGPAAAV